MLVVMAALNPAYRLSQRSSFLDILSANASLQDVRLNFLICLLCRVFLLQRALSFPPVRDRSIAASKRGFCRS